jgi:arylsulfatase A-like enzyme
MLKLWSNLWLLIVLLIVGCMVSTGSNQWRITWDKKALEFKQDFLSKIDSAHLKQKPNIVLIVVDDLGKYEVSAYGGKNLQTPNIDRIGQQGVIFTDGYVTSPTCAPSRAGLLTGRYQERFGFETQPMDYYPFNKLEYFLGKNVTNTGDWVMTSKPKYPTEWQMAKQGLPPTEIALPEMLKQAGYTNGIAGKWHLGFHKGLLPQNRGFDYQYGFYGAFSLYTPNQNTQGYEYFIQDDFSSEYQWKAGRKENGAIYENGKRIKENQYLTFAIRDRSIEFMKQNKDRPFFMYVSFNAPHVPFQAPENYYEKFAHVDDKNKRVYYAMISALDDAVGSIDSALTALGLDDNTIVFFISDNGGASYTGATDNGPLKGGKLTTFEGGVNVPFMMKWKGKIEPGTIYHQPVLSTDIFQTCIEVLGLPLPNDRVYDGVNLMPFITGQNKTNPHDDIYWRIEHIQTMRLGDWKFVKSLRDDWLELYNLNADKSEKVDLSGIEQENLNQILQKFEEWNLSLPSKPLWPLIMNRKFVIDGETYLFPA